MEEKKERKKYSVNRFADEQEYSKSIKEGDGRLTLGTRKLMAISSRGEEGIEDLEDRWRKSLLEFLKLSSNAAARKVGMRL